MPPKDGKGLSGRVEEGCVGAYEDSHRRLGFYDPNSKELVKKLILNSVFYHFIFKTIFLLITFSKLANIIAFAFLCRSTELISESLPLSSWDLKAAELSARDTLVFTLHKEELETHLRHINNDIMLVKQKISVTFI